MAKIPDTYTFHLRDIPTNYNVTADAGLDDIRIKEVPRLVTQSDVNLRSENVIRIVEFPKIRVHMPVHMKIGASVLGIELFAVTICGESQVITEDYVPNCYERCEDEEKPHH